MFARLVNETISGGTPADLFLGEVNDVPRAKKFGLFTPLKPEEIPNLRSVPKDLLLDPDLTIVPYEHGFITLVYDSTKLKPEELPKTFEDLTKPQYQKKLIVQNALTSSVGQSFLFWTIYNYGEGKYLDYWRRLLPSILTIQPGWSAAYKLFTRGEAPMVVSFLRMSASMRATSRSCLILKGIARSLGRASSRAPTTPSSRESL
jgi:thiamine transport system substrate-binding protein